MSKGHNHKGFGFRVLGRNIKVPLVVDSSRTRLILGLGRVYGYWVLGRLGLISDQTFAIKSI